jgi:hypothetical protein
MCSGALSEKLPLWLRAVRGGMGLAYSFSGMTLPTAAAW